MTMAGSAIRLTPMRSTSDADERHHHRARDVRCHHRGREHAALPAELGADRLQQDAERKEDDGAVADDQGKGRTKHHEPAGGDAAGASGATKGSSRAGCVMQLPMRRFLPGDFPGQQPSLIKYPDLDME